MQQGKMIEESRSVSYSYHCEIDCHDGRTLKQLMSYLRRPQYLKRDNLFYLMSDMYGMINHAEEYLIHCSAKISSLVEFRCAAIRRNMIQCIKTDVNWLSLISSKLATFISRCLTDNDSVSTAEADLLAL